LIINNIWSFFLVNNNELKVWSNALLNTVSCWNLNYNFSDSCIKKHWKDILSNFKLSIQRFRNSCVYFFDQCLVIESGICRINKAMNTNSLSCVSTGISGNCFYSTCLANRKGPKSVINEYLWRKLSNTCDLCACSNIKWRIPTSNIPDA